MSPPNSTLDKPTGVLVRKPKTSLYSVLLGVAAVAIAVGCLFLILELSSYGLLSAPWNPRI